ncbi:MAG TPA: glycosyltransferase [Myxococcales bacterium]|nr:glycosyltransferase [Myxococcales bacterium]HAN30003.1 glycosyltransferase [Myxococcales bacterium]
MNDSQRPFQILGVQQVAVGSLDKGRLRRLWVELLGAEPLGTYRSSSENVDEDICAVGQGSAQVEIDLMQPIDPEGRPRVHSPALNHVGLWVDDLHVAHRWLSEQGVRFTPGGIRKGAAGHDVCFIHPKGNEETPLSGEGVLIELVQWPTGADLSVVIPVFDERENLRPLCERLVAVLDTLGKSWEVILVDDGSEDGSDAVLDEIASTDARLKVIHFRRNFGQTAALAAGFEEACGDIVVAMDADLQNDPQDIPALLGKLAEGFDVVAGWRKDRKDALFSVTLPSRMGNWLIGRVTGVRLHDYGCTLKVFRSELLSDVRIYGEMHRYLPVFAHHAGGRIAEMPVQHHQRTWGRSKYSLWKTFRVLLDLLTVHFLAAYATKPLYFFGRLTMSAWVGSLGCIGWAAYRKFADGEFVKDQPIFILGIFFAAVGLQLLVFGLLAELMMRTYYESQGRPIYFVRSRKNFSP